MHVIRLAFACQDFPDGDAIEAVSHGHGFRRTHDVKYTGQTLDVAWFDVHVMRAAQDHSIRPRDAETTERFVTDCLASGNILRSIDSSRQGTA